MSSPLKLALITLGCASVFAAAPYLVAELAPLQSADAPAARAVSPVRQAPTVVASPVAPKVSAPAPKATPLVVAKAPEAFKAPAAAPKASTSTPAVRVEVAAASTRAPMVVAAAPSTPIAQAPKPPPAPTATPKPEIVFQPEVAKAQQAMNKLGLYAESADGKLGTRTQVAIKDFQKKNGLPESGQADKATLAKLESSVALAAAAEATRQAEAKRAKDAEIAAAAATAAPTTTITPTVAEVSLAPIQPVLAKADLKLPPVPRITKVPEVRRIQQALVAAKCYSGVADGKWGHLTIVGLKSFQERSGLKMTGKMDKTTWAKLYAAQQESAAGATAPATPNAVVASAPVAPPSEPKASIVTAKPEPAKAPAPVPAQASATAPVKLVSGSVGTQSGSVAPGIIAEARTALKNPAPAKTEAAPVVQKPTVEAAHATTAAAVSGPQPGEVLAISGPAAEGTTPKPNVVVSVGNSDANPGERPAIETPIAISPEARDISASAGTQAAGQTRNEALERDMAAARERDAARAGSLKAGGETVKVIGAADKVSDRLESPVETRSVSTSRAATTKANPKAEAQAKVQEVEEAYKAVKARWAEQVRRGTLADTMSKIDSGFQAMKEDFKKGNYDPILKLGDGFKLRITMLSDEAAAAYVEDQMSNKTVRARISDEQAQEIEKLKKDKKFVEAADIVAACAKKSPPKTSEATATKSRRTKTKSSGDKEATDDKGKSADAEKKDETADKKQDEQSADSEKKPVETRRKKSVAKSTEKKDETADKKLDTSEKDQSGDSEKKPAETRRKKSVAKNTEKKDETADKKQDTSEKEQSGDSEKKPAETSKKKSVTKSSESDEKPATKTTSKSRATSRKKGTSGTTAKKATDKDTSSGDEKPAAPKKTSTKSAPKESTDE